MLEPTLNVLGGLTPSVGTALGWAGIANPSITIPQYTCLCLMDPPEALVKLFSSMTASITKLH